MPALTSAPLLATPLAARRPSAVPAWVRPLWRTSPPLVLSAAALGSLAVICLVGLALDPRTLLGEPVWTKPLKFCTSGALYALALAVLLEPLRGRLVARVAGWVVGGILVVEVGLVVLQAARGVRSHFNVGTAFDASLYASMGVMIGVLWAVTLVAAIALVLTPGPDALWKRATVWGLALTLAGGAVGPLMTRPTPAQVASFAEAPPTTVGAHTVGAPDGGPGLPVVGWSTVAGDLRVPHFWGLHGLQAIPLLALWLRRRRLTERQRSRLLTAGGVAYGGLFGVLLQQALRGQPLAGPDAWTVGLALALLATAAAAVLVTLRTD